MSGQDKTSTVRRQLGAVLFADVVGYARLMGNDEIDTYSALKSLLEQLETACQAHDGRVVAVRGDGVLALFETATNAVKFGIELHRIAEQSNASRPEDHRLRFRAGVHMGEILIDDRGIHGDNVNIAARLQEIAEPGRVFVSSSVYEQIRNRLRFGFEFLGPQRLKNIAEPIPAYCVRSEIEGAAMAATLRPDSPPAHPQLPGIPSVAVLPFSSLGGDQSDSWFADGLTEDIILNLSKFKNLFVIARNSAFFFKARTMPPQEAARELGVRYVARGSIRRASSRIRVAIELIDAESGRTIWGERYDRDIDDIFAIQDEVTDAIVAATAVLIEAQERKRMSQAAPADLAAYGYVLRGQQYIFRYTRQDNRQAQSLYERALARDQDYARASAAISRTLNIDWRYSWAKDADHALDTALSFAQRAVELDPTDARGFGELGFVHLYRKEHDAAIGAYRRALALNPNDADLLSDYADALAHSGDNETAISSLKQAMRLNPYFPDQYLWHLGGAYYNLKEYDAVIDTLTRMNNPTEGQRMLAASYAQLGKMELARDMAARHREAHPNFSLERWAKVQPDRLAEDTQHFVEGLKKAGF
ncbi:adenylate/guanylate cyclase domain-containing protein [Leisingera daeponensis]|uniref:Adenylate/guanylate cyclase domain-containing protein n=1 Tax=Leisingera daeponensis TaxID=405746 RepID=A0ABS7NJE0_9RHOB|nr:adenylate/guanylate cyclase domain-containing protein [Leisingera daeponensis]MBY6058699.1 adenylate/guanylate cyclase domain-containing protein [Leisingera daeponensis]MBY6141026.1 adenylate/guanylate cyclase domain-containing protein [Leisingera daeponensis]